MNLTPKRSGLTSAGKILVVLMLVCNFPSVAQVGHNPNGFHTTGTGNNSDDNGNHNGHDNTNNPKSTNIPVDQHVWLLLAGGIGIAIWQYRKQEELKKKHEPI